MFTSLKKTIVQVNRTRSLCNNMCESPWWTPTVSIIYVRRSFFEKVINNWLQLIEALMAPMRVFEMFISEFNIPKYVYNTCTFQNMIMNSFDNCNTTKTIIKCNCFVYRNTSSQMDVTIHQPLRSFCKIWNCPSGRFVLEYQKADLPSEYKWL